MPCCQCARLNEGLPHLRVDKEAACPPSGGRAAFPLRPHPAGKDFWLLPPFPHVSRTAADRWSPRLCRWERACCHSPAAVRRALVTMWHFCPLFRVSASGHQGTLLLGPDIPSSLTIYSCAGRGCAPRLSRHRTVATATSAEALIFSLFGKYNINTICHNSLRSTIMLGF